MRFFPDYIEQLRRQWVELFGMPEPATRVHWDRHVEYLKRVVPEDRLVWYDVKDGWQPLCRVLGKEVPDVEFPRINDSKAIEELAKKMVVRGLMRWGMVIGGSVGVLGWWWLM
jgi:hypothetical protein